MGYVRRNFLAPVPSFQSFDALNAHLEERCLARMDSVLRGHDETIGQRMERDLEALLPLPAVPYDACDKQASRVSSLSLVRYKTNDYSAPVAFGHRDVLVKGYVAEVVISCGAEVIARHPRSYASVTLRLAEVMEDRPLMTVLYEREEKGDPQTGPSRPCCRRRWCGARGDLGLLPPSLSVVSGAAFPGGAGPFPPAPWRSGPFATAAPSTPTRAATPP